MTEMPEKVYAWRYRDRDQTPLNFGDQEPCVYSDMAYDTVQCYQRVDFPTIEELLNKLPDTASWQLHKYKAPYAKKSGEKEINNQAFSIIVSGIPEFGTYGIKEFGSTLAEAIQKAILKIHHTERKY